MHKDPSELQKECEEGNDFLSHWMQRGKLSVTEMLCKAAEAGRGRWGGKEGGAND